MSFRRMVSSHRVTEATARRFRANSGHSLYGVAPAGLDRGYVLLPEYFEDYISESPTRSRWGHRGMGTLGFLGVVPEATGRPAYHPGDRGMFRRSERQRVWRTECATSRPRPRTICSQSSRRGSPSIRQPGGSSQTPRGTRFARAAAGVHRSKFGTLL